MKYFTKELYWAANDWVRQTRAQEKRAVTRYWRTVTAYRKHLLTLRARLSKPAFRFFMYGFGRYGLHDARLLRFSVGDGLEFRPTGQPFYINRQFTEARFEFLNYYQDLHYSFSCRGVRRIRSDISTVECGIGLQFQDLQCYEISAVSKDCLRLGFLFISGGTIEVDFRKLVFRRKRVPNPRFNEMYR